MEADSSGETEAGTTQRDVIRTGVAEISVSFSVSPKWVKRLTVYSKLPKIAVRYFDIEVLELKEAENAGIGKCKKKMGISDKDDKPLK